MRLDFSLLVVDDAPDSVDGAVADLGDWLEGQGFRLNRQNAEDLSPDGIKRLARLDGANFDLVMVDFNLGKHPSGAVAARNLRQFMKYTDILFYSSLNQTELLSKLSEENVPGVFVSHRRTLGDALRGISETIIKKAIDLNHMRGIAMAEVAEMDVLMGTLLDEVFSTGHHSFRKPAEKTLKRLLERAAENKKDLEPIVADGNILAAIRDQRKFTSRDKYRALTRICGIVPDIPAGPLATLKDYDVDIIDNRNTLAHARETTDDLGRCFLESLRPTGEPEIIDEQWMIQFRTKLHSHRDALKNVCDHIYRHIACLEDIAEEQA